MKKAIIILGVLGVGYWAYNKHLSTRFEYKTIDYLAKTVTILAGKETWTLNLNDFTSLQVNNERSIDFIDLGNGLAELVLKDEYKKEVRKLMTIDFNRSAFDVLLNADLS